MFDFRHHDLALRRKEHVLRLVAPRPSMLCSRFDWGHDCPAVCTMQAAGCLARSSDELSRLYAGTPFHVQVLALAGIPTPKLLPCSYYRPWSRPPRRVATCFEAPRKFCEFFISTIETYHSIQYNPSSTLHYLLFRTPALVAYHFDRRLARVTAPSSHL